MIIGISFINSVLNRFYKLGVTLYDVFIFVAGEPCFHLTDGVVLDVGQMDQLLSAHGWNESHIVDVVFADRLQIRVEVKNRTLTQKENNVMSALKEKFLEEYRNSLGLEAFNAIAKKATEHLDSYIQSVTVATAAWEQDAGRKSSTRKPILEPNIQDAIRASIAGEPLPVPAEGDISSIREAQDRELIHNISSSLFSIAAGIFLAEFRELL